MSNAVLSCGIWNLIENAIEQYEREHGRNPAALILRFKFSRCEEVKFIEDGNFPRWLRATFFVLGLAIFLGSLAIDWLPRWLRMTCFLLGFGMMALGGFASRAHMLHIKPFDNTYKKARKSYETKDDKNGKQGGT